MAPQALRLLTVGSERRATALLTRLGCAWRLSSAALSMKHAFAAHDNQALLLASMQKATKKARVQYCQSALPGVAGATLACACLVIILCLSNVLLASPQKAPSKPSTQLSCLPLQRKSFNIAWCLARSSAAGSAARLCSGGAILGRA